MDKDQPAPSPLGPNWIERLASLRLGAVARGLTGLACFLAAVSLWLELEGTLGGTLFLAFLPAVTAASLLAGWPVGAAVAAVSASVWMLPGHPSEPPMGERLWGLASFAALAALDLAVIAGFSHALARGRARDEWARELVVAERSMLTELDHRMANTLQAITGLLDRSSRASGSAETRRVLEDVTGRVMVFARIHRRMSTPEGDVATFLQTLCADLRTAFGATGVEVNVDCDPIGLDPRRAETVALLVAELLTNAIKHAFPNQTTGSVTVSLLSHGPLLRLQVRDDGVGMGVGEVAGSASLGRSLVRMLAHRLGGTATWSDPEQAGGHGTVARVEFPQRLST